MKKVISILIFVLAFSSISLAQSDAKYDKALKKMFKVSGSEETYATGVTQMLSMFRKQYPNVDSEVWTEFEKEFEQTSLTELTSLLTPVYKKHFTLKDLKELIKFYESPIGKKLAAKNPFILQESMEVGQQWGAKIGKEFVEKMKEKGY
jgi:hypothetical protein